MKRLRIKFSMVNSEVFFVYRISNSEEELMREINKLIGELDSLIFTNTENQKIILKCSNICSVKCV